MTDSNFNAILRERIQSTGLRAVLKAVLTEARNLYDEGEEAREQMEEDLSDLNEAVYGNQ